MSRIVQYMVLILIPLVTVEVEVNIVPKNSLLCSMCLTLDDFADRTSQMDVANDTTLLLESGEHFLTTVTLMNVHSFSLLSRTGGALVTCSNLPTGFKFNNICEVKLMGIKFIGCGSFVPFHTAVFEFLQVENVIIDECRLISSKGKVTPLNTIDFFKNVTNIDLDTIRSSAVRICFCLNGKPNCALQINHFVNVLKEEAFSVPIIAVNQVEKAVNATILSKTRSQQGYLHPLQTSREISNVCTNLTFNVYSLENILIIWSLYLLMVRAET